MTERIQIDPEIKGWLPVLTDDERRGLEQSLKREGCRDALVVWKNDGKWTLLDGQNRFEICEANGIQYRTVERRFDSKEDALDWVIDNQLGKRNITTESRAYLIGKKYNRVKAKRGGDKKSEPQNDSAVAVAEQFKVTARTVKRDGEFSKSVDEIGEVIGADAKNKILSGESGVSQKDMPLLARAVNEKPEEVKAVIEGKLPVSKVVKKEKEKKVKSPRAVPETPKGRQVTQRYLRGLLRDIGACALTSTSDCTDKSADSIIGQAIQASNTRVVAQAIAILVEEWPADGVAFFKGTVGHLKKPGSGNGKGVSISDKNRALVERLISEGS